MNKIFTLGEKIWFVLTTFWLCCNFLYLTIFGWYPNFSIHTSLIYLITYLICLFVVYKKQ